MLPLSLLKAGIGRPVLVELKNGETYNGTLVSCDTFMNMNLKTVICTSRDGDRFTKIASCYIRGATVKYLCVPDEVIDLVPQQLDEDDVKQQQKQTQQSGAGGRQRYYSGTRGGAGGQQQRQRAVQQGGVPGVKRPPPHS